MGGSPQGGAAGGAGESQGGSSQGGASQGGAAGAAGSASKLPVCVMSCTTAADCAIPNSFPATEFACENGACVYKGCTSDAICQQVFNSQAYLCRDSLGIKMCVRACATAEGCALDQGTYSADNFTCNVDFCDFKGCLNDEECSITMLTDGYRCAAMAGSTLKSCQKSCASPAECGMDSSPAYASTQYACELGICVYKGCPSDTACKESMVNQSYVCK